jgi:hypothetical protein
MVTQGVPMTRTFGQLDATGWSGPTWIAVSLSYPFFQTTVFARGSVVDLAQQISFGGPQSITATAGMGNGAPGIPGTVIVMSAIHVAMGANQSMFMVGANTIVRVPLSAGQAGHFSGTFAVTGALHKITVDFLAWTPGAFVFTGLTSKGQPLPTVVASGSFNLNPMNGDGTVTLVSPSKISIDGALAQRRTAGFTSLVLTFPEPSSLLLLGAAGIALAAASRRV